MKPDFNNNLDFDCLMDEVMAIGVWTFISCCTQLGGGSNLSDDWGLRNMLTWSLQLVHLTGRITLRRELKTCSMKGLLGISRC